MGLDISYQSNMVKIEKPDDEDEDGYLIHNYYYSASYNGGFQYQLGSLDNKSWVKSVEVLPLLNNRDKSPEVGGTAGENLVEPINILMLNWEGYVGG